MLQRFAAMVKGRLFGDIQKDCRDALLLQGRIASWNVRAKEKISSLADVEFKVCSQFGEDGIIDWIIERGQFPDHLQSFIEFGVELYEEANTRFLLENRNWRGLIIDSNSQLETKIRNSDLAWKHTLKTRSSFITRENINGIFSDCGFSGEIGLLSIDIDGNDYWVWETIESVDPIVVICEYNAVLGDLYPIVVPYEPAFVRTRPNFHNLYAGASINALQSLAERKGYKLLGSNSAGNNAFFVRDDYAAHFSNGTISKAVVYSSRIRESRDAAGDLSFAEGTARQTLISTLPVINVKTGEQVTIGSLGNLSSDDWLRRNRRDLVDDYMNSSS